MTGAVLVARWPAYNGEETPSEADTKVSQLSWHDAKRPSRDFAGMLEESLAAAVDLLAMGRRVLIVGPLPEFRHSAPECMLRAKLYGLPQESCGIGRELVVRRAGESMQVLRRLADRFPNTMAVDPTDVFCDPTPVCRSDQAAFTLATTITSRRSAPRWCTGASGRSSTGLSGSMRP